MTTLLHPPIPSLKNKNASLKSLFNFGCSDQWLVTVITGWQERRPCVEPNACVVWSVSHVLPGGWYHWELVTSGARGGSGFSPEPGVAGCSHSLPCLHVSGSTTDWDLIIGEGKRCDYRQFMVWAILESWRAFRLHGSLIKQDTQLYNFSPLCISVFLAFCVFYITFLGNQASWNFLCRDLLLIKQTHVLATILPLCLSILWILRCIKSHKFGWIFNVSKYFWEPLFLKVIGNYHIWC